MPGTRSGTSTQTSLTSPLASMSSVEWWRPSFPPFNNWRDLRGAQSAAARSSASAKMDWFPSFSVQATKGTIHFICWHAESFVGVSWHSWHDWGSRCCTINSARADSSLTVFYFYLSKMMTIIKIHSKKRNQSVLWKQSYHRCYYTASALLIPANFFATAKRIWSFEKEWLAGFLLTLIVRKKRMKRVVKQETKGAIEGEIERRVCVSGRGGGSWVRGGPDPFLTVAWLCKKAGLHQLALSLLIFVFHLM